MRLFSCKVELKPAPIHKRTVKWNWRGDKVGEEINTKYSVELIRSFRLFGLTVLRTHFYVKFWDDIDNKTIRPNNRVIRICLVGVGEYTRYGTFPSLEFVEEIIEDMNNNPDKYILD